ncbi:MAG: esterase-like activity of phytase family protein [Woeseiaceae bacterium]
MHAPKFLLKKSILIATMATTLSMSAAIADDDHSNGFKRIATFPVYLNTDINSETVAEIVAASKDGNTLVYTDGKTDNLGFVDITNPAKPLAAGVTSLGGEPTSVTVAGQYALAAVNTSANFVTPSGNLQVIDITSHALVTSFDLGGQPDSIAVSADGKYAVVAIENERDEDLGDGAPSQAPAGYVVIVDMVGMPADWSMRKISLTGLSGMRFADDPEPEYVDINSNNIAVITLQENNHIVLLDLKSGDVINHFSAGTVDLTQIDTIKDKLIELNGSLKNVPREPDGVSWISNSQFVTADEGDFVGGTRGFTIFNTDGSIAYAAGNSVEHTIVRHGHFPDKRAGKKGNEPENAEFGKFGKDELLFIGSERASVALVYKLKHNGKAPKLMQVLPTAVKPEGLLAIPQRNLFITAGEKDDRGDKIRSALTIYKRGEGTNYPTIVSKNRRDGTPIPWGALSGLAMDRHDEDTVYTVQDSFYKKSRILKIDIDDIPAKIKKEIILKDMMGKLAAINPSMVNADSTVNLDPEGIATRKDGGFWMASEGKGTIGSSAKPFETLNLLLRVSKKGLIEEVVTLPTTVNNRQVKFGFEGVTTVDTKKGEIVYVAFQREWAGDIKNHVRIGRYDTASNEWSFFYYPLETPLSINGGWVGLSDITYLGDDEFAVIERDNQGGPDAAIKRIYKISIKGLVATADDGSTPNFPIVNKTLARDLMGDLKATGGLILEKIEGLAVTEDGTVLVVNDNDGVDDSNGETQLLRLKNILNH